MTDLTPPARPAAVVGVAPWLRDQLFAPETWAALGDAAETVLVDEPGGLAAALDALDSALAARVEVLVISWGTPRLDAALLDRLPALRLLAHTGASVKPFVSPELFDRGVRVTQAGQGMARPVAEVSVTFALALLHRIPRFHNALHDGAAWAEAEDAGPQHEIAGTRVGVIGASRTGRAAIAMLQALGAEVVVADPTLTAADADALGVALLPLDDLLATSRVTMIHAPTLPETHHLVGARELALMPDGSGLVNTARSWLVDEGALVRELATGRLDAALDVYDDEPLPADHPLRRLPNVLLTPHHAAATVQGRLRQGAVVAGEVRRFLADGTLEHEVRRESLDTIA
ncbi:hydroxyacid dehydrogenase [Isoptericola sp. BMS4]|uniref:hydroxyacid dehydrogenase n=1 Tax=Isoptericola sp. BMS4 TaxID=2527875 RepID=UPI001421E981|nr:hydroxyacid dehydrogenase [Isoptericola sp. BMS4]